ncbi:MAG: haloacid dehalogenase [Chloroflexi bacterium]|nr:MAG: haloacid dehalogenase [Chloroflexota bacterium]
MTVRGKLAGEKTSASGQVETGRSYWQILRANLFSFFNIILFSVGVILLLFGRYSDAFITVSAGLAGTIVNAFHEIRAKRQLDKISLLVRPEVRVIRDGIEQTIDPAQLVPGDTVHLRTGDQVQADGVVVSDNGAELDESLLTGESDLVRKKPGDSILSGSFCVNGDLIYRAEAVGAESFANQLTAAARAFTPVSTPLQQQVALTIRLLMVLTVFMALVFYISGFIRHLNFVQNVEASAVLIGLIPYGLFLTINLAYTLGAVRIARAGAVVQQTNAVESLRYVDVLCMDKTGTLTTNALELDAVQPLAQISESELKQHLGDFAHSASTANATTVAIREGIAGRHRQPVDEVRFASARKWSALAFDDEEGRGLFVLGAPEMLQPYLSAETNGPDLAYQVQDWSDQGLRVLLYAYNPDVTTLHDAAGDPTLPPLQPLGLISLRDELRPHAREVLSEFGRLGVQLKIISGDNPRTVAALVKQTGLVNPKLVTGAELAAMSTAEFEQAAEEATIFGRIAPEQKAQLVTALIKRGHYVAMIGDGVNDILALKKAKLGIAMQSGSSATRNVADMVLLDDSYAALAPALSEGKRISNGLTNATLLLITRALTYAFVIIGVLMVGLDFPFEPAQAGVTAITVGLPAFFLTLWARPQAKTEPLLPALARFVLPVALWSMLIGVALYTFVYYRTGLALSEAFIPPGLIARFERYTGMTYQVDQQFGLTATTIVAQTALSVFLSLGALVLILFLEPPVALLATWRTVSPDRRPALLAVGLMVLLVAALYVPAVANFLGFLPPFRPIWRDILVALMVWALGLWLIWRKRWVERLLAWDV